MGAFYDKRRCSNYHTETGHDKGTQVQLFRGKNFLTASNLCYKSRINTKMHISSCRETLDQNCRQFFCTVAKRGILQNTHTRLMIHVDIMPTIGAKLNTLYKDRFLFIDEISNERLTTDAINAMRVLKTTTERRN